MARFVLSGTIHRVAQSNWDCPNMDRNKALYLYFQLENPLPAGGFIKIDFPSSFKLIPTTCDIWPITTTLKHPTDPNTRYKGTITATGSSSPITFYCSLKSSPYSNATDQALEAGKVYGMSLAGQAVVPKGAYAPIGL